MPPAEQLHVVCAEQLVGHLTEDANGRLSFAYAASWLAGNLAFPISLALPLGDGAFDSHRAHPFFANLLPEGSVRQRICERHHISVDNDAALLRTIGGDCAGALSITTGKSQSRDDHYEQIDEGTLEQWASGAVSALATTSGTRGVRLSLAGAQDKLPVRRDEDGFWLPVGNSPSTHLLKFASDRFEQLVHNEVFVSLLAKHIGLPVVEIDVYPTAGGPIAVVERYDRIERDGEIVRLHQEDVCQSLAISPARKYEKEGGPSLQQCAALARTYCNEPALAVDALLKWDVFNVVVGNSDAHGKNVSFLLGPAGVTLAPFYDLVCTRAYPQLDRELAMSIGGAFDPDTLGSKRWRGEADRLEVRARVVIQTIEQTSESIVSGIASVASEFEQRHGPSPILQTLPSAITKRARRLLRNS